MYSSNDGGGGGSTVTLHTTTMPYTSWLKSGKIKWVVFWTNYVWDYVIFLFLIFYSAKLEQLFSGTIGMFKICEKK